MESRPQDSTCKPASRASRLLVSWRLLLRRLLSCCVTFAGPAAAPHNTWQSRHPVIPVLSLILPTFGVPPNHKSHIRSTSKLLLMHGVPSASGRLAHDVGLRQITLLVSAGFVLPELHECPSMQFYVDGEQARPSLWSLLALALKFWDLPGAVSASSIAQATGTAVRRPVHGSSNA